MPEDSVHVHTEECDRTPELEARLNAEPQKPLTEAQFRKLRGQFFTIRHHRVQPCNHLLDQINEPTFRNCESCWFVFFNSHAELVEVTDKAFQEQGFRFLDKMRGVTYRKAFTSFMSTIARMKKESDEQNRDIQGSGSVGQNDGQNEGRVIDVSETGRPGESTDTLSPDESNLAG